LWSDVVTVPARRFLIQDLVDYLYVYPSFPDAQLSSFSVYGNEVSIDIKSAMIMFAHLVITSCRVTEIDELTTNLVNADVTPPRHHARVA
jgi:hypothetical protein